jgi:hypothetical protein
MERGEVGIGPLFIGGKNSDKLREGSVPAGMVVAELTAEVYDVLPQRGH